MTIMMLKMMILIKSNLFCYYYCQVVAVVVASQSFSCNLFFFTVFFCVYFSHWKFTRKNLLIRRSCHYYCRRCYPLCFSTCNIVIAAGASASTLLLLLCSLFVHSLARSLTHSSSLMSKSTHLPGNFASLTTQCGMRGFSVTPTIVQRGTRLRVAPSDAMLCEPATVRPSQQ